MPPKLKPTRPRKPSRLKLGPGAVVVPDLPPERLARWHLLCASVQLGMAYNEAREDKATARTLEAARVVAFSAWEAIGGSADARKRLLEMATRADGASKRKIDKSDVEAALVAKLPRTPAEARRDYSWEELGEHEASRNVANVILLSLAAGHHGGAARVLRRWGITTWQEALTSSHFAEDREQLASAIRLYVDGALDEGEPLPEALVRAAYRVLGLPRPFEAARKKALR